MKLVGESKFDNENMFSRDQVLYICNNMAINSQDPENEDIHRFKKRQIKAVHKHTDAQNDDIIKTSLEQSNVSTLDDIQSLVRSEVDLTNNSMHDDTNTCLQTKSLEVVTDKLSGLE